MLKLPHIEHKIERTALLLTVFIGIFMPCLVHVRMQYLVIVMLIVFTAWRALKCRDLRFERCMAKTLVAFLPFLAYYSVLVMYRTLMEQGDTSSYLIEYRQILSICVYVFSLACATSTYIQTYGKAGKEYIIGAIILVGEIQLLCVVAAYLSPTVKIAFNNLTIENSYSDTIVAVMQTPWRMSYRAYGLAENLFDQFGFVTSIIITITFAYGVSCRNKGLIVLSCMMLIMPFLNARTGILLAIMGMAIVAIRFGNFRNIVKYQLGVLILIVCVIMVFDSLPDGLKLALVKGADEFSGLLRGERVGVFSEIFDVDLVFPRNVLLGQGMSPERYDGYAGIDSGYVQCIWRYGVIGTVLLFGGFIYCFFLAFKKKREKVSRTIVLFLSLSLPVYCLKIFPFVSYSNMFILFLLVFTVVLGNETPKKWILKDEAGQVNRTETLHAA